MTKINHLPPLHGRILLVEDVEDNRILITFYIQKTGASVETVSHGQQALELLNYTKFDLIFMDMQMPVMDGLCTTREIRNRGILTPIVVLTASSSSSDKLACELAGANGFLTKPVDPMILYDALSTYLHVGPGQPGIDDVCTAFRDIDTDILDIVHRLVETLPERISPLGKMIENQDWDALKPALHELKGATGNAGLFPIAAILLKMEFQVQDERYDHLPALNENLKQAINHLKSCMQNDTRRFHPQSNGL